MPTTPSLAPEVDLLGSRQEVMDMPAPPTKSLAPANSINGNIFGEHLISLLHWRTCGTDHHCTASCRPIEANASHPVNVWGPHGSYQVCYSLHTTVNGQERWEGNQGNGMLAVPDRRVTHKSGRQSTGGGAYAGQADLQGGPYACTAADAAAAIGFDLGPVLTEGGRNAPHRCPASQAPMWEGEQVAESPYQKFMQVRRPL